MIQRINKYFRVSSISNSLLSAIAIGGSIDNKLLSSNKHFLVKLICKGAKFADILYTQHPLAAKN